MSAVYTYLEVHLEGVEGEPVQSLDLTGGQTGSRHVDEAGVLHRQVSGRLLQVNVRSGQGVVR